MEYFRFFLAEDQDDPREQIQKLLSEAFPGAVVDVVENVEEGLRCLKEAQIAGVSYDIAYLDFMLPIRRGETPKVDESLCCHFRLNPDTLIGHITGYADDPPIKRHLAEVHPDSDARGFIIDKREPGWPDKLLTRTRQCLYGERIQRQIERIFGRPGAVPVDSARSSRFGSGPRPLGSLTNAIADLCFDISQYWNDLHPAVQERIRQRFQVDPTPDGIKVTLR